MIVPKSTVADWEARSQSLPFGQERKALGYCALSLAKAYQGALEEANVLLGKALSAGGETPESNDLRDTIASLAPVRETLAGIHAAEEAAYYTKNVALSSEVKAKLEDDNKLTAKVLAVAESGGNANLAYGLATLGEKTAEAGQQITDAAVTAIGGFKGPLIVAGILAVLGVGAYLYVGSKI